MMELVDMPGRSILASVSRLWTCHLKRVGWVFRVPFCDPTEGVLEILFGDVFCMGGDPLRKKSDREYITHCSDADPTSVLLTQS